MTTAFGDWPLSALRQPAAEPSADRFELTVRSDALTLERADDGLCIVDLRVAGRSDLAVVEAADATLINVELPRPHGFRPGDRVRVLPQDRSVLVAVPDEKIANATHSQ